jgi:hypothetical protein
LPLFIELTPISRAEVRVVVRPDQSLLKELGAVAGVGDAALILRPKQTNGNARNPRFARKPGAAGRQPAMFNGPPGTAAPEAQASAAVTRFN